MVSSRLKLSGIEHYSLICYYSQAALTVLNPHPPPPSPLHLHVPEAFADLQYTKAAAEAN